MGDNPFADLDSGDPRQRRPLSATAIATLIVAALPWFCFSPLLLALAVEQYWQGQDLEAGAYFLGACALLVLGAGILGYAGWQMWSSRRPEKR